MEARDSGPKIRPLPVDDLDVDAPQQTPIEPKRRWTPLVVIAVGAIAFGVIATGLGPGKPDSVGGQTTAPPATIAEASPATTTTILPEPPTLAEMIPFAENGMQLVAVSNTSARIGEWYPDASAPTFGNTIMQPRSAAFNIDGTRVMVQTWSGGDTALTVTETGGANPLHLRNVTSGRWHPDDPDLLAWTEYDSRTGSDTIVKVADLSGDRSAGISPLNEFVLEGEQTIRAWGDWGFATAKDLAVLLAHPDRSQPALTASVSTFIFDPDGLEIGIATGTLFDAAADGTLLLGDLTGDEPMPYLRNPDGSITELPGLDVGASDYQITADGQWVLAVTLQADGHTSILARAVNTRSTRLTSVEQAARVVGTMAGDRALVLQEVQSNDLVFKDWSSGAEYRVPVDSQIGAVYVDWSP